MSVKYIEVPDRSKSFMRYKQNKSYKYKPGRVNRVKRIDYTSPKCLVEYLNKDYNRHADEVLAFYEHILKCPKSAWPEMIERAFNKI